MSTAQYRMAQRTMAADSEKSVHACLIPDCELTLVLTEDQSRHSACKHNLTKASQYFQKMFLGGEFKEKRSKEIQIEGVSESDLVVFLSALEPFKPLPSDAAALCSLIFLADRFICPRLKKEIQAHLETESMFDATVASKLKLLEAADNNRGESTGILEACIRLCASLTINQVYHLQGRVSVGTLAAAFAIIGQMVEADRQSLGYFPVPEHYCGRENAPKVPFEYISGGQFRCSNCKKEKDVSDYRPRYDDMMKIEIKKEMLFPQERNKDED